MDNQFFNIETANVMITGKSGAGKSTLINAVFGRKVAKTGIGHPVTDKIEPYVVEGTPFHIWDTCGLELDSSNSQKYIEDIKKVIVEGVNSKEKHDQIHAIWYCINCNGNRYEESERDFIKSISSNGIPFLIILTQCYGTKKNISELEAYIREDNSKNGLKDVPVVSVLAEEWTFGDDEGNEHKKASFGMKELFDRTLEMIPKYVYSSFVAAQVFNKALKRDDCENKIWEFIENTTLNKSIGNIFVEVQPVIKALVASGRIDKLYKYISQIYNGTIPEEDYAAFKDELGGLSVKNAFFGLTGWFVSTGFDKKLRKYFYSDGISNRKHDREFEGIFDKKHKKSRIAKLLVLYGYIFLESIEKYWDEIIKRQKEDKKKDMDKLIEILRDSFEKF